MDPIYSRSSRLVKSKKGMSTSCCQGISKTLKRRRKVQKGGWIGPEVSKPIGCDWNREDKGHEEEEEEEEQNDGYLNGRWLVTS